MCECYTAVYKRFSPHFSLCNFSKVVLPTILAITRCWGYHNLLNHFLLMFSIYSLVKYVQGGGLFMLLVCFRAACNCKQSNETKILVKLQVFIKWTWIFCAHIFRNSILLKMKFYSVHKWIHWRITNSSSPSHSSVCSPLQTYYEVKNIAI